MPVNFSETDIYCLKTTEIARRKYYLFLAVLTVLSGCAINRPCDIPEPLAQNVAEIRGLSFINPVRCTVVTPAEMEDLLMESTSESNEQERLRLEEAEFKILGFLGLDDSYEELLERYYRNEVGGFYSPKRRVIISNLGFAGERGQEVLAHELTHSLQDQHFGLQEITSEHVTTDCGLARLAAIEGDANRVMRLSRGKDPCKFDLNIGVDLDIHRTEFGEEPAPSHVGFRRLNSFPYHYGVRLVCGLIAEGGTLRLNEVIQNPPGSTADILHAEYKTKDVTPCRLRPQPNSPDSIGEFGVFALLSQWLTLEEAKLAAEGLAGDELTWEGDSVRWQLWWGSYSDAREFIDLFRRAQIKRLSLASIPEEQAEAGFISNDQITIRILHDKQSLDVTVIYKPLVELD